MRRTGEDNRIEFEKGFVETIPLMIGCTPFGFAFGVLAVQVGLTPVEAGVMSGLVYAGAAQFVALGLLKAGAGYALVVLSSFLVNLRYLLMGLSLSPYLSHLGMRWLAGIAFGTVDESYARTISHYQSSGVRRGNPYYMVGSTLGLYAFWMGSSIGGAVLGGALGDPFQWGLDFAMPATFITIVTPQLTGLRGALVFLAAGASALLGMELLPGSWYLVTAAVAGSALGALLEIAAGREGAGCAGGRSS